jgi:hypothetical protein
MVHRVRLAELQDRRLNDKVAAFESYGAAIRDALGRPRAAQAARVLRAPGRGHRSRADRRGGLALPLGRARRAQRRRAGPPAAGHRLTRPAARRGDAGLHLLPQDPRPHPRRRRGALLARGPLPRRQGQPALYDVLLRRAELAGDGDAELPLRLQAGRAGAGAGAHRRGGDRLRAGLDAASGTARGLEGARQRLHQGGQWSDLSSLLERRPAPGHDRAGRGGDPLPPRRHRACRAQAPRPGARAPGRRAARRARPPRGHQAPRELLQDAEAQVDAANLLEPVYVAATPGLSWWASTRSASSTPRTRPSA